MIYNDAYAPLLGARHPAALGARAAEVWSDIWDDIGGDGRRGLRRARDLLRGPPAGDEPARVRGGDLLHLLLQPGPGAGRAGGRPASTPSWRRRSGSSPPAGSASCSGWAACPGRCTAARPSRWPRRSRVLAEARSDCPFGLVYLTGDDEQDARLVAGQGIGIEGQLSTSVIPDQVREVIATGETVTVTGLAELLPGLSSAGASPIGEADVHTAVVLPLTLVGPEPAHRCPGARHQPAPAAGRRVPHLPHPGRRTGRGRRRRRAGGRGRAPSRRRAGRAGPLPGAVLHRRRGHPAARRPRPDRRCRTGSPSTTSRPPGRWRWAATGTTSSTCRTAGTAWSWATSSAVVWPRRR